MREGLQSFTVILGSVQEVDMDQRTREVNRLLMLGADVSVLDRGRMIKQRG